MQGFHYSQRTVVLQRNVHTAAISGVDTIRKEAYGTSINVLPSKKQVLCGLCDYCMHNSKLKTL